MKVERVHATKFLGMTVDDQLTWKEQINLTCTNISIYFNNKVKHILDDNNLYTLYFTLILLYLSYACKIWGNTYPTRLNNTVMLQKRAIRIIDKATYRDHTDPLFSK